MLLKQKKKKKERLKNDAKEKVKGKDKKDGKKPVSLKCGLNHVTYLIEQKRAKLVLVAADVDPIETVVFFLHYAKLWIFLMLLFHQRQDWEA